MSDAETPGTAHARLDQLEANVKRLWLEVAALALCLLALATIQFLGRHSVG